MNVRTLASVSTFFAVVSCIVAANLWRELRVEREQTAAFRAQMSGAADPASPVHHLAETATALTRSTHVSLAPAAPPAGDTVGISHDVSVHRQELTADPEYRKVRLALIRASVMRNHPGITEELRLTEDEAGRLFDLLAETRLAMEAEAAIAADQADPAISRQVARRQRALQTAQAEALRAMMGDDRYAQWREYQQTQPVRLKASTYAEALAQARVPLDGAQTRTLTTAMIEEQERLKQDILALGRSVDLGLPQTQAEAQEALRRRQQESGQHVLDAASPYLSALQVDILRQQMERQADP